MDPEVARALEDAVSGRVEPMLDSIRALVTVNSYTENKGGGDEVGRLIASQAESIGLVVRRVPSQRYADHLVIATPAARDSAAGAVAFVGHHDTVFPPGTFEGFTRDDKLARGPGVLDMKGGIVVMLEAIRALGERAASIPVRIVLVGDEEIGSPEGQGVIADEVRGAACALVFEAGRAADKIITSRKGTGSAKVVATGKSAHAANDHKSGVNAIWAMARFIDRAQALTDYARGVTINVGVINGGEAKNTVPDRCEVDLDFRFEKIADGRGTFAALEAAAAQAAASVAGSSLVVSGGPKRLPLERTAENVALYEAYAAHARAAGLGSEEASLIAGGSDASTTAALGIPSIDGLGPRGAGFHTKDERIEIDSLEPKVLALARFLVGRSP
jgi:glutamate carboxypeptidase